MSSSDDADAGPDGEPAAPAEAGEEDNAEAAPEQDGPSEPETSPPETSPPEEPPPEEPPPPEETPPADVEGTRALFGERIHPSLRFLLMITLLALATRFIWVMWVHPPEYFVFSDMKKYVDRAQELAALGFRPNIRPLAWQAWGTHYLLAVPLKLFGRDNFTAASLMWALMGALSVPLGYLLACRVCSRHIIAQLVAVALLLWHPNLSNSGYFLSETPFLFFQLWSTYWLVVTLQEGRRALGAGLVSAVTFAIRPQSALFFLLVLVTWLINRKRLRHVGAKQLVAIALPLLLMLGFSLWRFHQHTGYWFGVAENANMNLTAGRCHNIVTQAFKNHAQRRRSARRGNTRDGRRVSLPAFRMLSKKVPHDHPLGLRPALGSETIRFVGYVGDPDVQREIRRACYAKTGTFEQIRYSIVNVTLLYFVGHQWPEMERGRKRFMPAIEAFKHIYQVVFWFPSLIGIAWAIGRIRKRPGLTFCAWQLVTSMTVATIFFGTIRLRTPYDPYAIILAIEVWAMLVLAIQARIRRSK